ncbi:hypothetical protein BD408DRAFT_409400 [Parasitella parasitica]|nr:hypothetical protein BD408DRAFT_409400 [Parasitella parasitica]
MSFPYYPMLDNSQDTTIMCDDNLLFSIMPANMMIKQEQIVADDLLLTAGYYPQLYQDFAGISYPSNGYSSCSSSSSNNSAYDTAYYANASTHATGPVSSVTCSSSPSSHYSYDNLYSPSDSFTSFDFFSPNSTCNDSSLYEYWSNNSSPALVNQTFDASYFEQSTADVLGDSLSMPSYTSSSLPSTSTASVATLSGRKKPQIEGKPYSCSTCRRAFARKHDLQRHVRVHTGDKPYMCPCCKKTFARTDALKRHLRMEDQCRQSDEVQALKETGRKRYKNL